jgi:hypothetical protein
MVIGAWNKSLSSHCTATLMFTAVGALACSSEDPAADEAEDGLVVSSQFAAQGAMGDAETLGNLVTYDAMGCKARPAGAVGDCYAYDYIAGPLLWAGLYWQHPANNWGSTPGLPVDGERLTKFTFQAAVEAGPEQVKFVIGGIGTDRTPQEKIMFPYEDQMKAEVTFSVTTEWQTFEIPVPKQSDGVTPISELLGAFAWYLEHPDGIDYTTAPTKTLYLDDLVYE